MSVKQKKYRISSNILNRRSQSVHTTFEYKWWIILPLHLSSNIVIACNLLFLFRCCSMRHIERALQAHSIASIAPIFTRQNHREIHLLGRRWFLSVFYRMCTALFSKMNDAWLALIELRVACAAESGSLTSYKHNVELYHQPKTVVEYAMSMKAKKCACNAPTPW